MAILGAFGNYGEGLSRSLTVLGGLQEKAKGDKALAKRLASDMARLNPELRNPLLSSINFYIPVERSILNQWIRYYYRFHPLVGNAIDFHTEMPMSRFGFKGIKDPSILKFYEEMAEELDMYNLLVDIMREYFLLGEAVPYLYWDEDYNCWTDAELINPDFINVRGHPLLMTGGSPIKGYNAKYIIELIPDQTLREFAGSTNPDDQELKEQMDPALLEALKTGNNIKLDPFNVSMIQRKQHRYEPRGTSIVLRCLKDLMYEDKLRESQYSIAEGHITPKQIWKLGDKDHIPTNEDLQDFRDLLINANNDPIFSIVSHYATTVEFHGAAGKILPLVPEFEFVYNRILTGLFLNKSLAHGEGVSHQNASIAMRALMSRYIQIRGMIEDWCNSKVFTPVAVANDFFDTTKAELDHHIRVTNKEGRALITPKLDWRAKSNLLDDTQVKNFILQLQGKLMLPMRVICDALDIDYDFAAQWLKAEEGTVFDKAYQDNRIKKYALMQQKLDQPPVKKTDEFGRQTEETMLEKGIPGAPEEAAPLEIGESIKPPVRAMLPSNNPPEYKVQLPSAEKNVETMVDDVDKDREDRVIEHKGKRLEAFKNQIKKSEDKLVKLNSALRKVNERKTIFSVLENRTNPLEIKIPEEEKNESGDNRQAGDDESSSN